MAMVRIAKRERDDHGDGGGAISVEAVDRRALRSRYLTVKTIILDEGDDISRVDSDKFDSIFNEVETLHEHVQKPREQVADAEALLDITKTLFSSVKSQSQGITVSHFISSLLALARSNCGSSSTDGVRNSLDWKQIGRMVADDFRSHPRCCTMIGTMSIEPKKRRSYVRRKRAMPARTDAPKNVDEAEKKTDTDKNMSTMFDILRQKRKVRLGDLIMNRNSFAQTVENVFALSFLVKDGRAMIDVDENNCHLVSPKNAPVAASIASKEVVYSHFVFRFDHQDWKLMKSVVKEGSELMPHRNPEGRSSANLPDPIWGESERTETKPPIRKLCRNRGLVSQGQSVSQHSNSEASAYEVDATHKGKEFS